MSNYYEILGLSHQAENDEIAKAFRRYAMAYNPLCHPQSSDLEMLRHSFKRVAQAYIILSDPKIRAIYDLFGEDGVRHGGTGQQGVPGGLDIDAIDPQVVFKRFFGVDNPFQVVGNVDVVQNNQHQFFSEDAVKPRQLPKCTPLFVTLPISLQDVFYGAIRLVQWQSTHAQQFGPSTFNSESFEVNVRRGAKTNDRFIIADRGNSAPGYARGDVIVLLNVQPHHRFRREKNDLVITVPISLTQALCGTSITVKTIDDRQLLVLIDEIVHPQYRSRVIGEGLPVDDSASATRGNLIIECATQFPNFLTLQQKVQLRRILQAKQSNAQAQYY